MKKQLFKKLLAFSIVVFSISNSFAQCPGNKVLVCHISRATGYLVCQCVHQTHVKTYLRNGWTVSSPTVVAKRDPAVTAKNLQPNTGSNSLPATNKIRGSRKKI
jgi:hypothetical protein